MGQWVYHLIDGAWGHSYEGEEDLDLCYSIKGAELVCDDGELVLIPRQIGTGPPVLALQLVQEVVQCLISVSHAGRSTDTLFRELE